MKKIALLLNNGSNGDHAKDVRQIEFELRQSGYQISVLCDESGKECRSPVELARFVRRVNPLDELMLVLAGQTSDDGLYSMEDRKLTARDLSQISRHARNVTVIDHDRKKTWGRDLPARGNFAYFSLPPLEDGGINFWRQGNVASAAKCTTNVERYCNSVAKSAGAQHGNIVPFFAGGVTYVDRGMGGTCTPSKVGAAPVEVQSQQQLWNILDNLPCGKYAIVYFGDASWCKSCRKYEPIFRKEARQASRQYLFLHVKNPEHFQPFNIEYYPMRRVFGMGLPKEGLEIGNKLSLLDNVARIVAEYFSQKR